MSRKCWSVERFFQQSFLWKPLINTQGFGFYNEKKIDLHWFCKLGWSLGTNFCMFESIFCGCLGFDSEWFVDTVFCASVFVVKGARCVPFKPFSIFCGFTLFEQKVTFCCLDHHDFFIKCYTFYFKKSVIPQN